MDLFTESLLLPKPQLMGIQNAAPGTNAQPPERGAAREPAGAGLAALLQNPLVQGYLARNPNAIGEAMARRQASAPDSMLAALEREPQRLWEQIPWMRDPAEVRSLAAETGQPILVEVVVGRLAEASNDAAC